MCLTSVLWCARVCVRTFVAPRTVAVHHQNIDTCSERPAANKLCVVCHTIAIEIHCQFQCGCIWEPCNRVERFTTMQARYLQCMNKIFERIKCPPRMLFNSDIFIVWWVRLNQLRLFFPIYQYQFAHSVLAKNKQMNRNDECNEPLIQIPQRVIWCVSEGLHDWHGHFVLDMDTVVIGWRINCTDSATITTDTDRFGHFQRWVRTGKTSHQFILLRWIRHICHIRQHLFSFFKFYSTRKFAGEFSAHLNGVHIYVMAVTVNHDRMDTNGGWDNFPRDKWSNCVLIQRWPM